MSVKVKIFKDHAGEYRWTAKATNGEPVADSDEGYTGKQHAKEAAHALFPDAEFIDE